MSFLLKDTYTPWSKLLILICFLCTSIFISQLIVIEFLDYPYIMLQVQSAGNTLRYKNYLFVMQAILASIIFIVTPLIYCFFIEKKHLTYFFQEKKYKLHTGLLTIGLVGSFMVVNSLFIYWNIHMKLPTFLKNFEQWAQMKEAELKTWTSLLTTFSSTKDLGIAIVVIAIIPAIGEELLFRGILQPLFYQITQHTHWSIIMSAFIFSTMHLQFYGFLPRFFLGMLFGYIYWWTKNLSFAILGHFFNNAATLVLLFLQQLAYINPAIDVTQVPSTKIVLLFAFMTYIFAKNLYQSTRKTYYS